MEYAKIQYPNPNDPSLPPYEMPAPSSKNELIKEEHVGPVEKRKPTNVEFLWLFGITIVLWLLLCFYCVYHGDLSRLDGGKLSSNTTSLLKEIAYNVKAGSGEIYLACTSAVVFSALLIILFRHFAGTIVWFVVGLVLTGLGLITFLAWYWYSQGIPFEEKSTSYSSYSSSRSKPSNDVPVVLPIIVTVVFIVVALVIYSIRKHIRMVIRLFKEGGKVTQSMPFILAQPFVIFIGIVIALFLNFYLGVWIISAEKVVKDEFDDEILEKDGLMIFAIWIHFLTVWWIIQFLIGCQHMVIAGATATWYFTRDKTRVGNAIKTSYKYLFKYHLGSVALGSLIITTIQFLRLMYRATVKKNARNFISCLFSGLFNYIEEFITFLTRNAYIEIAIYGDGFFVSGKRAFRVLTQNAIKVATINSVGDFVMLLGRCLVTGLAILIGYLLLQSRQSVTKIEYPLCVIGIVSFAVVHAFMLAFEMIVDSVFICFCEDCDIHDGVQRPYYMSKEMMVFIKEDREPKTLRVGDAAAE